MSRSGRRASTTLRDSPVGRKVGRTQHTLFKKGPVGENIKALVKSMHGFSQGSRESVESLDYDLPGQEDPKTVSRPDSDPFGLFERSVNGDITKDYELNKNMSMSYFQLKSKNKIISDEENIKFNGISYNNISEIIKIEKKSHDNKNTISGGDNYVYLIQFKIKNDTDGIYTGVWHNNSNIPEYSNYDLYDFFDKDIKFNESISKKPLGLLIRNNKPDPVLFIYIKDNGEICKIDHIYHNGEVECEEWGNFGSKKYKDILSEYIKSVKKIENKGGSSRRRHKKTMKYKKTKRIRKTTKRIRKTTKRIRKTMKRK
jgi:hypothetical protein